MERINEGLKRFYELRYQADARRQKSIWDPDVSAYILERMTEKEKRQAFYDYGMGDF